LKISLSLAAAAQFVMAILEHYSTLVPVRDNPLSLLIFWNNLSLTRKGGGAMGD
jgi:hypothetical protein